MSEIRAPGNRGGEKARQLFSHREPGIVNVRTISVRTDGSVVFEGHDLDKELEKFVGRDEWEAELTVATPDVPHLLRCLRRAFGPLPARPKSQAEEVLDLIGKGFGGDIRCMTRFEEWCQEQRIKFTKWTY